MQLTTPHDANPSLSSNGSLNVAILHSHDDGGKLDQLRFCLTFGFSWKFNLVCKIKLLSGHKHTNTVIPSPRTKILVTKVGKIVVLAACACRKTWRRWRRWRITSEKLEALGRISFLLRLLRANNESVFCGRHQTRGGPVAVYVCVFVGVLGVEWVWFNWIIKLGFSPLWWRRRITTRKWLTWWARVR